MNQNTQSLLLEIKQLFPFLKGQVPRLHKAILETHNLGLKTIIVWVLTLSVAATLCSLVLAGMLVPQVFLTFQYLFLVPSGILYSLAIFFGSGFLLLLWVQYELKKELIADEWWEFYFLCYLPLWLGGLFSALLILVIGAKLGALLNLVYFFLALYLFYTGLKIRYLTTPKQKQLLKGVLVGLGVLIFLSQSRAIGILFH